MKLLFNGDQRKADSLFVEKFSNKRIVRSHQTLGNLEIQLGHKDIQNYKRALNLNTGIASVEYDLAGSTFRQEVFVSYPDEVMAIHLEIEGPEALEGTIRLNRPTDMGVETVRTFGARQ